MSRYKNNQLETLSTANASRTENLPNTAYIEWVLETRDIAQENKNQRRKKNWNENK